MRIGIAGAGVAGRLAAFFLSRAGHAVTVFESSASENPARGTLRAAGWTAAGMLSPVAEMESGGAMVRDLGLRSLALWKSIHEIAPVGLSINDSLMVCHAQDLGAAQRVLRLLQDPASGMSTWPSNGPASTLAATPFALETLSGQQAKALAPELKGTLYAWRLSGEGHLHPATALSTLRESAPHVSWQFNAPVEALSPGGLSVGGQMHRFDWVLDCRGTGAAHNDSGKPVRGVRGEVVTLHAPGFRLQRAVRLLHPRWRVYVVPHPNDHVVVGATEIESEDRSPISVQSVMELLSAAFSIFPALAEARVLHTDVNLRPATPDNLPLIHVREGLTTINGLFRHGWLLGPAVVESALLQSQLWQPHEAAA